ncbi:MAG: AzlC family ABC transporter permease [Pseudomonadota bacterium]
MSHLDPFPTDRAALWAGARSMVPMLVGAVPFGLLFGALASAAGLPLWGTMAISLLVFAGSAQFIAVGLIAQGAAIGMIILTTFIVNLRHALYAASLLPFIGHLPQRWLAPLAFTLTDESYAITINRFRACPHDPRGRWFQLGASFAMYLNWQLCTVLGAIAGTQLSDVGELGLEIAMAVTFIGIVVPLLRSAPMLAAAVVAGAVGVLGHALPHQLGLFLGAVCGIAVGYALESARERRPASTP